MASCFWCNAAGHCGLADEVYPPSHCATDGYCEDTGNCDNYEPAYDEDYYDDQDYYWDGIDDDD